MGLFASQFNTVSPYQPVGLDTGTPQVGLNLPRTPEEKTPTDDTPAEVPARPSPSASNAASAAANATANANAGISAQNAAANQQRAYESLMHMTARDVAGGNPATITAPAHVPAQAGILGDITHAVNNVAQNPIVRDVMHFGDPFHSSGVAGLVNPVQASTVAPSVQQGIRVNSIKLNQGSPQYDVQAPQYAAMPRGWSANAVGSGSPRLAIEAPQPGYSQFLTEPGETAYAAMPRGWSANVNPVQFGNVGSDAASSLPRGVQANGGWESDLGSILGDIADGL